MSVGSETAKAGPYLCDGSQTVFPFGFAVLEASHIAVYNGDGQITSGFTVTLAGTGGNVTFATAPASGTKISIIRDVPFTQLTDLQNNTAFLPEVLETMSDKLTMECQQLKEKIGRAIVVNPNDSSMDPDTLLDTVRTAATTATTAATTATTAATTATAVKVQCDGIKDDCEEIKEEMEESCNSVAIGTIFPFVSSTPPPGAYLCNGQTIANCSTLYPDFWTWLNTNKGTFVDVWKTWVQPVLTEDGTMGTSDVAVEADSVASTTYPAYKCMDATTTTSWRTAASPTLPTSYRIYTKKAIKVSSINVTNINSANMAPTTYKVYGSDDGSTWTALTAELTNTVTTSGGTWQMPVSSTAAYHYHKIEIIARGTSTTVGFGILSFNAIYLSHQESNGAIRCFNSDTPFDAELTSTGNCGAFVIGTASVRLPSITTGFIQGGDSTNKGTSVAAGLPNMIGEVNPVAMGARSSSPSASDALSITYDGVEFQVPDEGDSWVDGYKVTLNASSSNSIYGNSTTVQPPAVRYPFCIQVYNASTTLSTQEAAQLASEMQTKMQKDFGNAEWGDMDIVVETYQNGTEWYRKYKSGWVEQGNTANTGASVTITFPTAFADTNYTLVNVGYVIGGAGNQNITAKTTTYFETSYSTNIIYSRAWYACGMGSTSVTA